MALQGAAAAAPAVLSSGHCGAKITQGSELRTCVSETKEQCRSSTEARDQIRKEFLMQLNLRLRGAPTKMLAFAGAVLLAAISSPHPGAITFGAPAAALTISCPPDQFVDNDPGRCTAVVNPGTASSPGAT